MLLLYIRHGLPGDRQNGKRNTAHSPLVREGRLQLQATGAWLRDRGIWPDAIACSELPRARDSALEVADVLGFSRHHIVVAAQLNERDAGQAKGLSEREICRRWPNGFDYVPGAETARVLQDRAADAAAMLSGLRSCSGQPARVVLAVGHGVHCRALARHYSGLPYSAEYVREHRHSLALYFGGVMRMYPSPVTTLRLGAA